MLDKLMRKTLLTTTILTSAFTFSAVTNVNAATFTDVKTNHWAYSSVEQAAKKGYVAGFEGGSFKPIGNVTRAEFATFLSRTFDGDDRVAEPFTDVPDSHWAKDSIEEGLALGFIQLNDFKNNTFEPNKAMTRQEISKWLSNALKASNAEYGEIITIIQNGKYTLLPIAEYYKRGLNKSEYGNVGLMLGTGLMSGFEDGLFKATGKTTRAEVATILIRFDEAKKKAPSNFKGLNELVEVATTGTNMLSATKFKYWGENFGDVVGKAHTFSRNNAGVGTLERLIFVEGTTVQTALSNSIFAKMFVGKDTWLARDNNAINVFIETGFTSNHAKTTIEAYSNGNTSSFLTNTGVSDKKNIKNYGLVTLDSDNWGIIFKKGQKVKFWTESILDYSIGYSNGFTVDDGTRFGLKK